MLSSEPYLSVVSASRNDDHGGDLVSRMEIFIHALNEQTTRHGLDVELILVEWNPPPESPSLLDVLEWPAPNPRCRIRVLTVPSHLHRRRAHSENLPFFQMIAKNVGIRRARAPFILATNVDLLFSDDLVRFLSHRKLEDRMYRVDRYDVAPEVPRTSSIEEQLRFCENNVTRIHFRNRTLDLRTGELLGTPEATRPQRTFLRGVDLVRRVLPRPTVHALRDMLPARMRSQLPRPFEYQAVHTNACGDFTLLSKERWFRLRGYAELDTFSFHLDSLLCWAAFYSGAKQVELQSPHRMYHIDHAGGWTPEVEKTGSLNNSLASRGIPRITDEQLERWLEEMRIHGQPLILNGEDWGLAEHELDETSPHLA